MSNARPLLYVKTACPWCAQATELLDRRGITYDTVNVTLDRAAFQEMVKISAQTKAPTLNWNGTILADFGASELAVFLDSPAIVQHMGTASNKGVE